MLKRPFKSLIARIAIIALALSLVVPFVPAAFAQDTSIDYAENGTGPVATFFATDEDDDPIEWSLAETGDYKLFTIVGGVLAFKKSPNYEVPGTAPGGTIADRNVYNVTVEAAGGTHEVAITVTDVDEDGKVTIDKPQPQVARGLVASLKDDDGGETDEVWQWARSEDGETWTDIEGATSQSRSPATADVGTYLRASVVYTDSFAEGKTASAVTTNRVEGKTLANAAPSFKDQDDVDTDPLELPTTEGIQINRSVDENTPGGVNIGKPVSATDADNDILIYKLGGADEDSFEIASSTGQLKTKADVVLDSDDDNSDDSNATMTVTVTATDPSGASSGAQLVTITINDVNESPTFDKTAPTTLWVTEGATALRTKKVAGDDTALGATALTAPDDDDDDVVTYDLVESDDNAVFTLNASTGELTVTPPTEEPLDYETQSSYSITIVASSQPAAGADASRLRTSRLSVTINVVDAEDGGTIKFTQRQPQVGRSVIAEVNDPDGGVTISKWEWAAVEATEGNCGVAVFPDTVAEDSLLSSSASYTPNDDDDIVGDCLMARATYTDNIAGDGDVSPVDNDGDGETSNMDGVYAVGGMPGVVQESRTQNAAPKFPDQDPNKAGDQSDDTGREVAENTKTKQSIGAAVTANDADDSYLLYTLSGTDADSFDLDRDSGQLKTKAELDYESKTTYTAMVTATDPSGATDSIMVTINVTNEDDPADITADSSIDYAENGTGLVATFTATDEDDDPIEWSLAETGDYKLFTIDGGVLAFKKSPNYEVPNAAVTGGTLADRNVYRVTIEATGGTHEVAITVTDVDEDGKVTIDKPQPQVARGLVASLKDADGGETDEVWQWARSEDGETWTDIEGATSQSRAPEAEDAGMYLRASVVYTDSFAEGKTASAVTTNRVEGKTLANAAPSFKDQDDVDTDPLELPTTEGIQINRSVDENTPGGMNIGKPVSATDADNDILIYKLGGADEDSFEIASSTGQLKTKADVVLDSDDDNSDDSNATMTVTVTATDPSGASSGAQLVTITINDVNESPTFDKTAPTTLWVTEGATALRTKKVAGDDTALGATALTAPDDDDDDVVTYDLVESDDNAVFTLNASTGELTVTPPTEEPLDYETQSSYSITIVASSQPAAGADASRLRTSRLSVTINVVDAEDGGTIKFAQRQAQVGRSVIAEVNDPDGGVTISKWEWAAVEATEGNCGVAVFPDTVAEDSLLSSSASYTPNDDDDIVGDCLMARATYTDNIAGDGDVSPVDNDGDGETSNMDGVYAVGGMPGVVQESRTQNAAPKFPDQDPNKAGDQSDDTGREVAENTKTKQSIGAAVTANDADDSYLLYTLSGTDADSFDLDRDSGQLRTKAELDYESRTTYTAMVTATDPSGATDSIMVTINVTNEDDGAVISLTPPVAPIVAMDGSVTLSSDSPAVGDAITATLEDGNEVTGLTWQWSNHAIGDEAYADIEGATDASYTPTAADFGKHVKATASYSDDSSEEGQTAMAATANLVNNAPAFDAETAALTVDENAEAMAAVGDPVVATDVNEEELAYTITGDDAASFAIWPSGQITVAPDAAIDYETKTSYSVTVTATDAADASASIDVTIAVNDLGLSNAYDTNDSGDIDKDEAVQAVQDYFADTITRGEVLEVLQLYFAG